MEESEGTEAADAWYKGWEDESAIQIGSVTDAEDTGVVYPFDYGLSYTEFEWEITESNMDVDTKGTIQLTVNVTNTGDHAGKDVVELYYTAPYSQGGIEKSNDGLLQQMLRDEWGFEGTVLTDAAAYPYMSQDNFVFNSGDLLLAIGQNELLDVTKESASGVIEMRRAVKNKKK